MKTEQTCITTDHYSAPPFPISGNSAKNPNRSGGKNRSYFSLLFLKIFTLCSLGVVLLSSCEKNKDELASPTDAASLIGQEKAAGAATYYVAPNGSDAANGDITHPFATLTKAWTVVAAGNTIYMRGGTYAFNTQQRLTGRNGTAGNLIKVWAYPGETPNLTKSSSYSANQGLFFTGDYVHFKGLEISGYAQVATGVCAGIRVENSSHNIFESLNLHHNGKGMEIAGQGTTAHVTDNLVLNCDAHHNQDPLDSYGNGDGFSLAWVTHAEDVNTIRGCRSWWNSDDGFDLYQNEGMVNIENSQAFYNGYKPDTFTLAGDGNGFKLGNTTLNQGGTIKRKVTNCLSYKNSMFGFHDNASVCNIELDNNTAYQNGRAGGWSGGFHFTGAGIAYVIKNNVAYGNLPNNMEIGVTTNVNHNSWNGSVTVTDADFASITSTGIGGARQTDGSFSSLTFMHLAAGSDLINAGVNVGLAFSGTAPCLGAYELNSGGGTITPPPTPPPTSTNLAPVIQNQAFQLSKTSSNGTAVGTVIATDPNAGQTLAYSILSGNTNSAFAINSSTGNITVANSGAFATGTTTGSNYSVFQSTSPSSTATNHVGNGTAPLEMGMKFRSSVNGFVTGFRFYKGVGGKGIHIGNLWSITGTKLASATFTGETASGWQTVTLSTPVAITANTIYVVSYFSANGDYVKTYPYFNADKVSGPLTALGWTKAQPNGVYKYSATSAFPNNNAYISNSNYWADVIFTSSSTSTSTTTSFPLVVKVQDNGTGSLNSQATVSINMK
jgi:hypothetical protein